MAKKYLSIEEAAAQLGVSSEELNRLRESGEIRGFADRGNWKFKPEDVEEFGRQRQTDSDPSVPILDSGIDVGLEDADAPSTGGSSVVLEDSVVLGGDEAEDVGEQPTIIRKGDGAGLAGSGSDSDVRLVLDDSLSTDSDPDVVVPSETDSDSDVRLVSEKDKDSDSDVALVSANSDSDVKLVSDESNSDVALVSPGTDSDSDVKLVGDNTESDIVAQTEDSTPSSDSDVQLIGTDVGTDEEIPLAPIDEPEETISVIADESGITLDAGGSGSGIAADSGIALEGVDDSGIALVADEDSGIALVGTEDSGISLAEPTDSGIALEALMGDDDNKTVPMSGSAVLGGDLDATQLDVSAANDDSGYELADAKGSASDTGVIVFDDDSEFDDHAATRVQKSAGDDFDAVEGEEFDFEDDMEVAEDVFGEDDELDDMDVFDAGDEDFAESFEGESAAEFITPGMPVGGIAVPQQQEWGVGTFIGLSLSFVLMVGCLWVMSDFVRSMWHWEQPSGFTSSIMESLGGFFKK